MYSGPYFIPSYYANPMPMPGLGFRFKNGFSLFKNINWNGLLNGASKTLGVVNQTIPLVKRVGPMVNNVKSMFRLMTAFRDETVTNNKTQEKTSNEDNNYYNNSPTFFDI